MSIVLEKEYANLFNKLKVICKNAPVLKGKNNMIELDPKNKQHREWFEEDL